MQILTRKILDAKNPCKKNSDQIDWLHKKPLVSSICLGEYIALSSFHCKSGYVYDTSVCTGQTRRARFLLCPIIQRRERWNRSLNVSRRDINEIDCEVTLTEMLLVSTRLLKSTSLLFICVFRICWENFPQQSAVVLIFHDFICQFM